MEKLKSVLMALNSIEVHGEKNLNYLLASIQMLNDYIAQKESNASENEEKNNASV